MTPSSICSLARPSIAVRLTTFWLALVLAANFARAQMSWSSYDLTAGTRISASAATFNSATNSYTFTVPANATYTFVTTNFVPFTVPVSTIKAVTFSAIATGGYGPAGTPVQNCFTNFGFFNTGATAPAASGNFTDDTGLWMTFYQQTGAFNSRPAGTSGTSGSTQFCPAGLMPLNPTNPNYGLGTARGGSGLINDNMLVDVTLRINASSSGVLTLGNGTSLTQAGTVWIDRDTNGTVLNRTVYSNNAGSGGTVNASSTTSFNEFAYQFQNGTAAPITFTLSNFSLVGPPFLTIQPPASSTVTVGDTLTLASTSAGSPASYQWQYSADGTAFANIDAATQPSAATAILSIASLATANAGSYRVIVSNAAGSTTSASSTVAVTTNPVPPTVLTAPASVTVLAGAPASFSVSANGTSPLAYQWSKSADGTTYTTIAGATGPIFSLPATALTDSARYRVTITNAVGSATSAPAILTVNKVPVISTQPVGTLLNAGTAYTLSVVATGTPAPTYQWKLNGTAIAGATDASLPLTSLSATSSGVYTVTATNAAGFVNSTPVYVGIPTSMTSSLWPANAASGVNPDTPLTIAFSGTPVVGSVGRVRVYESGTDTLIDTIDLSTFITKTAASGNLPGVTYRTTARTIGGASYDVTPIVIVGNTARIYLKGSALAYGKSYYAQIEPGVILDPTGASYPGISDKTSWAFATKAAGPAATATALTVAADGSADFTTLQGAIDLIPFSPANTTPRVITLKPGLYNELVHIRSGQNNISVIGESRTGTVIQYRNNGDMYNGVHFYYRGVFLMEANDFNLSNLTMKNLSPRYGSQAETLIINVNSLRSTVSRCNFFSLQDTLFLGNQAFVTDSYVEGDVDFMWGNGATLFQNCELKMMNTGYYTQIRNIPGTPGNVYVNCSLTRASATAVPDGLSYLGRIDVGTGGTTNVWPASMCVYIACKIDKHISPAAWLVTGGTNFTQIRYWEYNSTDMNGAPLNLSGRPTWNNIATGAPGADPVLPKQQIDAISAAFYSTPANVVGFTPAVAPVIDTQPIGQAALAGQSVTFTTSATTGYPVATYQWYKGGVAIPGATTASLALPNTTANDSGSYTLTLTSTAGTVTSSPAVLAVSNSAQTPAITTHPVSTTVAPGASATFTVAATGTAPLSYQWRFNGVDIQGATGTSLVVANIQPPQIGGYTAIVSNGVGTATTRPALLGLAITGKTLGTAYEQSANIQHPNGNLYDQVILNGSSATVTADTGQATRISFLDLSDDIVQVEFSGAGTLTLSLENPTGPALATKYNQPGVLYMKGHATLTLSGVNENTHVSIFTVGSLTAANTSVIKSGELYDGVADVALLNISSPTSRLGSARLANTEFFATRGLTGLNAPNIRFGGPVSLHNISAADQASPVLITGTIDSGQINIAGGDLQQINGRPVEIGLAAKIAMTAGTTSAGIPQPAQINRAQLIRNGQDVTAEVIKNP